MCFRSARKEPWPSVLSCSIYSCVYTHIYIYIYIITHKIIHYMLYMYMFLLHMWVFLKMGFPKPSLSIQFHA